MKDPTNSAPIAQSDAAATLAAWQQRDIEVRGAGKLRTGLARPEQLAGRSGIEIYHAMLAGEIPAPPICATLDFILVEAEAGRVQFQGKPQFAHYNPMGTVHGGWMATLLDSALGCVVQSSLPAGNGYTTVELNVNFVKALTDKVPLVRAIAESIHTGSRIATAQARITGPDGTLYAHATSTCIVLARDKS